MIPDRKGDRWYERKAVIEALATVPPILAAAIGALTSLSDRQKRAFGWWLLAGVVWMVGASVAKVLHARAQDRESKRADDYEGLRAALHVLFAAVCETAGLSAKDRCTGRVRITIHRVVPNGKDRPPEELEQLLPYMGGPGSAAGRRFSIRSGIIGKAARERVFVAATRENADHESFVAELVRHWAYIEHDARRLSPDRHAWVAVPILDANANVSAVVYLDSRESDFFTQAVKDVVLACCEGIATYTREVFR
jgi:putative methionine-R-sulfoxide reductase with GAF domain